MSKTVSTKAKNRAKTEKLTQFAKKQGIVKPFWNTWLFGVKPELNVLPSKLTKGERVYALVPCKFKGRKALAVVTSIRVIVLNQGFFGRLSNNSRDDVYYTQSSGGNPSGRYFSSYMIQIPGHNDWIITGLWGSDADTLDKAYNKARQAYEKHIYENGSYGDSVDRHTPPTGESVKNAYPVKLSRLKNLLESGQISESEYKILKDELDNDQL